MFCRVCYRPAIHIHSIFTFFFSSEYNPGTGTYKSGNSIFASVTGIRKVQDSPSGFGAKTIEVLTKRPAVVVPQINSLVYCRITRITTKSASASILAVEQTFLPDPFPATILRRNVRETEVDTEPMFNWFRPGDIVRARVVCDFSHPYLYYTTFFSRYLSFPLITFLFTPPISSPPHPPSDIIRRHPFLPSLHRCCRSRSHLRHQSRG